MFEIKYDTFLEANRVRRMSRGFFEHVHSLSMSKKDIEFVEIGKDRFIKEEYEKNQEIFDKFLGLM